jgi:hypothetical protein
VNEKPHTADLGTRWRYRHEGAEAERERLLRKLTELTDRLNRGETEANAVMYLYRFIEEQRKEK